jgi:hypothetical protein
LKRKKKGDTIEEITVGEVINWFDKPTTTTVGLNEQPESFYVEPEPKIENEKQKKKFQEELNELQENITFSDKKSSRGQTNSRNRNFGLEAIDDKQFKVKAYWKELILNRDNVSKDYPFFKPNTTPELKDTIKFFVAYLFIIDNYIDNRRLNVYDSNPFNIWFLSNNLEFNSENFRDTILLKNNTYPFIDTSKLSKHLNKEFKEKNPSTDNTKPSDSTSTTNLDPTTNNPSD